MEGALAAAVLVTHQRPCASSCSSASSGLRPEQSFPAAPALNPNQMWPQAKHLPGVWRCQLQLSTPIWPHKHSSSISVLGSVTQGGKFHQAAEHLVRLTKDLFIVRLILGHLGIPDLNAQTKSHKSRFHLAGGCCSLLTRCDRLLALAASRLFDLRFLKEYEVRGCRL